MMTTAKLLLPWLNGILSYFVWRAGGLIWSRSLIDGAMSGPVCVIQTNSLGDILMVTPLLQALIDRFGPGKVDVVVSRRTVELLKNMPGIGSLIAVEGHLRWRSPASVIRYIRTVNALRARRYGMIIDASRVVQSAWMTFWAGPAARRIGLRLTRKMGPFTVNRLGYLYTDEVEAAGQSHMIRENLALLGPTALPFHSESMRFIPAGDDCRAADAWLADRKLGSGAPFVIIHPGAKWPPKRWPADRFRQVAEHLLSRGLAVVLAGDASDRPLLMGIAEGMDPLPVVLSGELGLGALGALIQRARMLIGNDSSLMHMASAVGTPAVALFGPTFPEQTGPLGAAHRAIVQPISCRPCRLYYTRDRCERGHNYCMDLIETGQVLGVIDGMLAGPNPERSGGAPVIA